jgi:signal transduction histidine kinase
VAIAIQNARLYDEIHHLNRDLESLVGQRTEALQTAYNQLERLDRTKSDFISISSHELRTPLTLMRGYSQMLLDEREINQNDYLKQMVNGIQAGAIRLHEIVDSMLDVAKIDSRVLELQLGPVSIPTLLKYIHEGQKEALNQRMLTLTMDFEELPQIEADQEGLQKVFTNLVVNAIKFTPDGGRITITGRVLSPGTYELVEGGVEVIVSDTGIGIDPSAQVLIFRKFYQIGDVSLHSSGKTKFKGGGPGLGLAIAKGVVDAHGGLIWVESPGYDEQACPGSHFHVVLPTHPAVKKLKYAG